MQEKLKGKRNLFLRRIVEEPCAEKHEQFMMHVNGIREAMKKGEFYNVLYTGRGTFKTTALVYVAMTHLEGNLGIIVRYKGLAEYIKDETGYEYVYSVDRLDCHKINNQNVKGFLLEEGADRKLLKRLNEKFMFSHDPDLIKGGLICYDPSIKNILLNDGIIPITTERI